MDLPDGESMTLVPVGPLTNIALLLKVFLTVTEKIDEIVLMGGGTLVIEHLQQNSIFGRP